MIHERHIPPNKQNITITLQTKRKTIDLGNPYEMARYALKTELRPGALSIINTLAGSGELVAARYDNATCWSVTEPPLEKTWKYSGDWDWEGADEGEDEEEEGDERSVSTMGLTRRSWADREGRKKKSAADVRMKMIRELGASLLYSWRYLDALRRDASIQKNRTRVGPGGGGGCWGYPGFSPSFASWESLLGLLGKSRR